MGQLTFHNDILDAFLFVALLSCALPLLSQFRQNQRADGLNHPGQHIVPWVQEPCLREGGIVQVDAHFQY